MTLRLVLGLICSAYFVFPLFSVAREASEPAAQLLDSGALVAETSIWWIDSSRVLFHGYDQNQGREQSKPIHKDQFRFYLWDIRSNQLTSVARRVSNIICATEQGVAFYAIRGNSDSEWTLFAGRFGSEKDTGVTREQVNSRQAWINPVTCDVHKEPPEWVRLAPKYDDVRFLAAVKPMKDEHGFIYVAPGGTNSGVNRGEYEVILYRESDKKRVMLFQHSDSNARGAVLRLSYVPFMDKYLLSGTTKLVGEGIAPAWLVSPHGDVEYIAPANVPTPGADRYLLTKAGLVFPYLRTKDRLDTTINGLWLIRQGRIERVVVGITRGTTVAPNGCRIAFSHAIHHQAYYDGLENLRRGEVGYTTLKMADLCTLD
jgi:hypothetical protein